MAQTKMKSRHLKNLFVVLFKSIKTIVLVPGRGPSNVQVTVVSPFALRVSWEVGMSICLLPAKFVYSFDFSLVTDRCLCCHFLQALSEDEANGPLRGYKVLYKRSMSTEEPKEISAALNTRTVDITSLYPWTYYDVWVVAFNDVGDSALSAKQTVRTLPSGESFILRLGNSNR